MRFVLLKSGKIVEGRATSLGRETRIDLIDGGYFVVATEKVEKTFRAKRDVFNYKIAITPFSTMKQDRLFSWLCEKKAFKLAENHLTELATQNNDSLKGFDFNGWKLKLNSKRSQIPNKEKTEKYISIETGIQRNANQHLVLGCAISGCHNSDSNSKYQLTDSLYLDDKKQFKNIQTTKPMVQSMGKQKFLSYVSQKHGPLKRGMYPTATREYLAIATWVNRLKGDQQNESLLTKSTKNPRLKTIPNLSKMPVDRRPSKPAQKIGHQASNPEIGFIPRDEFDPEIFNRQQAKKWDVVAKPIPVRDPGSSAPQRLISPDKTNSRK